MRLKIFAVAALALILTSCTPLTYVQQQAYNATVELTRQDGAMCTAVIVQHVADTYRALTAAHCVLEDISDDPSEPEYVPAGDTFSISAAPGTTVIAAAKPVLVGNILENKDFAEVEFKSKWKFGVALISQEPLEENQDIFNVSIPLGMAKLVLPGKIMSLELGPTAPGGALAVISGATFGSSGSAIFNSDGEICGILVAKVNGEPLIFFIPISQVSMLR